MNKFDLQIEFQADWHIGSGAGIPGSVDRQVLRDGDELPFIPAKTLTGILRDAAEFVVAQLDRYRDPKAKGSWSGIARELFGGQQEKYGGQEFEEPREALLSIRPGRLPRPLAEVLRRKEKRRLLDSLFFIQPGVCIDRHSGRAKDDHLFFTEEVRAGCFFFAEITAPRELTAPETALLLAAVASVRRLGGKRRRGGGRCAMTLENGKKIDLPQHLKWLKENIDCDLNRPESPAGDAESGKASVRPAASGAWQAIPLTLTAKTPLVINRKTLGNEVESLDYLPGTLLLPIIHKKLAGRIDEPALRRAIATGRVVVTNLTPVLDGLPSYPVPQCLFYPKEGKVSPGDSGQERQNDEISLINGWLDSRQGGEQYKNCREGWLAVRPEKGKFRLLFNDGKNLKTQRTHNTVDDAPQRPTERVGGVFTYQAIKAGSAFSGELLLAPEWAAHWGLKEGAEEEIRIGRSKKDDYGQADLRTGKSAEKKPKDVTLHAGQYLVVRLLSDLLLRDAQLAYSADPRNLAGWLTEKLGVAVHLSEDNGFIRNIGRADRLESWQRQWMLPRPSLTGLQGGSVFTFEVPNDRTVLKKLAEMEITGIGDRRAEGFGRVCFNPDFLLVSAEQWQSGAKSVKSGEMGGVNKEAPAEFLRNLELEAWKMEIRRSARRYAFQEKQDFFGVKHEHWRRGKEPDPSTSQWGALRTAIARKSPTDSLTFTIHPTGEKDKEKTIEGDPELLPARAWVETVKVRKNRHDKWKSQDRLQAIENLLSEETTVWDFLPKPETCFPEVWTSEELAKTLRPFAVRTLIETVCEAVFDRAKNTKKAKNVKSADNESEVQS